MRMPPEVTRSGEASKRLTAAVLVAYGTVCWLQLPGCTMRATTKDHVIPVKQGGTDAMENLRPACLACNSRRRDMSIGGTPGGILVTFYIGPIAASCTAAALSAASGDDVVISFDRMAQALTPPGQTPTGFARAVAHRAFAAAMNQALRLRKPIHVRIAHPAPTLKQLQTWARLRYFIEAIDPGRSDANRIAATADRDTQLEVARWYDHYPEGQASIERAAARRAITSQPAAAATGEPVKASRAW